MWKWLKRRFARNNPVHGPANNDAGGELKWHEPGPDNPFGIRFLDVRSLTWKVVAATSDRKVVETSLAQRTANGRYFVEKRIDNAKTIQCDLRFPHNGAHLEGFVFQARSMEVKWDVYVCNSVFLFARSWTGQLQYRAFAEVGETSIRIRAIETAVDTETAPQAVYFILGTHAMRFVLPHAIPAHVGPDPNLIGHWSFSTYGRLACYATYDDVTKVNLRIPDEPPG